MVKEQEQILGTYVVDNVLKVGVRDLNLTLGGVIVLCFWQGSFGKALFSRSFVPGSRLK